jgi:hypothetical protein
MRSIHDLATGWSLAGAIALMLGARRKTMHDLGPLGMHGIVALLLSVFCLNASAAGLMPCDRAIRFAAGWFADPELDNTRSSAEVTSIGAAVNGKGLQLGHVMVEARLAVLPQESCSGFIVRLEFVKPVLRVASEIPPGTCAYARVLNHEQTHVRIYREIARQFRELEYPWHKGAASASILDYAKVELDRLMQAQVQFDNPEEYAKNQTVCGGEILRLVKAIAPSTPAQKPG